MPAVKTGDLVIFHPSDYASGSYKFALVTKVWSEDMINLVTVDRDYECPTEYKSVAHRSLVMGNLGVGYTY
jgi:hypothetical protein